MVMQVAEAYMKAVDFLMAKGFKSIKDLPGCAEAQVSDAWWIAANGHREDCKCSKGVTVPPFCLYIDYNGWPAGIVGPDGGTIAAGEYANEDAFIAALEAATQMA